MIDNGYKIADFGKVANAVHTFDLNDLLGS